MPKYEEAFYLDDLNQWECVGFQELGIMERRAELREKDLRESPNGIYQLGIRNHPQTPHFFQKKPIRNNIEKGVLESEEHEKQKSMVRNFLKKYEKHSFGYYESPWNEENKGYESIIRVKDYIWDTEVKFGLVYGKYVRFDILGRPKSELSFTDKFPYIAVEIVDSHFHSQEAFKILLETTKNIPLIVAYIFVPKAPYINGVKKPNRSNSFSTNRTPFYLSDGSFWDGNERMEDSLGDIAPENPEVYYNAIREMLYEKGFIKHY